MILQRIITVFIGKYNSSIIVFKDKVSGFIDCHLFYSVGNVQGIHDYIGKTKKRKKMALHK